MARGLPIAYPHIKNMADQELVPAIKAYRNVETSEFFYGKACPAFICLFNRFYTDSIDVLDFIHEVYADIMHVQKRVKHRKIDTFCYTSSFKNWVAFVALRYCQQKYQHRVNTQCVDFQQDDASSAEVPILCESSLLDRQDIDRLIAMMPNKRYQNIIRLLYVEGLSLEKTADILAMSIANLRTKRRLAQVQYLAVYNKDFSR